MRFNLLLKLTCFAGIFAAAGCVERKITIITDPADARVWLNDEEVGAAPVTVAFKWYGEYRVRVEKPGYQTLNTHQPMKRPLHDYVPFDFFAEVLWPGKIVDSYTWNYTLEPWKTQSNQELIDAAQQAKQTFAGEIATAKQQIEAEKTPKKN